MKLKAFSFNELLLVSALAAIMFLISAPFYLTFLSSTDSDRSVDIFIRYIKTAEVNASIGKDATEWGVCRIDEEIVLYKSTCLVSNSIARHQISSQVDVAGLSDIKFSRYNSVTSGNHTIEFSAGNHIKTIVINSIGGYEYQ